MPAQAGASIGGGLKVLVTGAAGFLGSYLCRRLTAAGYQVTAGCRSTGHVEQLDGLPVDIRGVDVTDADAVSRAAAGQDFVIHAAALIRYASPAADLEQVNVGGTRTVARACLAHGIRRLVHVSSMAAIGIPPAGVVADEGFRFNLGGRGLEYFFSKKQAEEAVAEEARRGLDAVIVNPTSIFGLHGESFRGGEMMAKVRRSRVVPYFAGGTCAVHVEDVAAGTLAALERGEAGQRYILGGENITYQSLARQSAAAMGLKRVFVPIWPPVTAAAARLSRLPYATHYTAGRCQFYSSAKAGQALGYKPRPFAEILLEYLAWSAGRTSHGASVAAASIPN